MSALSFRQSGKSFCGTCTALLFVASIFLDAWLANSFAREVFAKYDVTTLCELVDKMNVVFLKYYDDPDAAPAREVRPYAVGYTPSQNILFFGLQVNGYSKSAGSDSAMGWRNFRADRIKTIIAHDSTFAAIKPELPNRKIIVEYACKNKFAQGLGERR